MKWEKLGRGSRLLGGFFLSVLVSGGVAASPAGDAVPGGETGPERSRLEISCSQGPQKEIEQRMRSWFCELEPDLSQVRDSWTAVVAAIGRGDRGRWVDRCKQLHREVDQLISDFSLSPPDPISRFYFARGVEWLRSATADCSETRLFALSFGLSQARRMFRQFDRRLGWLGRPSCGSQPRQDSTPVIDDSRSHPW